MKREVVLFSVLMLFLTAWSKAEDPAVDMPDMGCMPSDTEMCLSGWQSETGGLLDSTSKAFFTQWPNEPRIDPPETGYGTMSQRNAIMNAIIAACSKKYDQIDRATVRAKWNELFSLNNACYAKAIGVNPNAQNMARIAQIWLPHNQKNVVAAQNQINALQAEYTKAYNEKQPRSVLDDLSRRYWDAKRTLVFYEEQVAATQDQIAAGGAPAMP